MSSLLTWGSSVQASLSWANLTEVKLREEEISAELLARPDMVRARLSEPTHIQTSPANTSSSWTRWGRTAAPLH